MTNLDSADIPFDSIISETTPDLAGQTVGALVYRLTTYLFPIVGLLIILYFLYGGYTYMTSRGNPQQLAQAQGIIVNALIGFGIVFTSFWIVQIVGYVLGISAFNEIFGSI